MTALDRKKLGESIAALYREACEDFDKSVDDELARRVGITPPHGIMPGREDVLKDVAFVSSVKLPQAGKARALVDDATRQTRRALAAPVPNELAGYVLALGARDDLTEDEARAGLARYGDNHMVSRAILSAARRSGLYGVSGKTATEKDLAALDALGGLVDRSMNSLAIAVDSEGVRAINASMLDDFASGRDFSPAPSGADAGGANASPAEITMMW